MSAPKKPGGSRPIPRRLFSLETLKRQKTSPSPDSDSPAHSRQQSSASSTFFSPSDQQERTGGLETWSEEITKSPEPIDVPLAAPEEARTRKQKRTPTLNLDGAGPSPVLSGESAIPPPSPSRRRWHTIQQQVIPDGPSGAASPPPLPETPHTPSTLVTTPHTAARPHTPRAYAFRPKKSLRHVVEQVRDAAAHDDTRKMTHNIRRAFIEVRYGRDTKPRTQKTERDTIQNTIGSTLHLPFVASSSEGQVSTGGTPKMRSPPSATPTDINAPSVLHMARVVTGAPSSARPPVLPLESQVLSGLLVPFVGPRSNSQIDYEQETAVETFEFVIRTWGAPSSEVELERCIWCCKAASVPSRSRVRILSALSSVLFAPDRDFVDSPMVLQSLLQNLFALLAVLAASPESPTEASAVRGFIKAIREGKAGTPTAQSLEKEYGVRYGKDDQDDRIRDVILTESVIGCLELGSMPTRRYVLYQLLEDNWISINQSAKLTPLLACMNWRKLKTFISAATSFLTNPTSHQDTIISDADVIVRILRNSILPEVEVMQDDAFAAENQSSVVRLVLELLCVRGSNERDFMVVYFSHWYLDSTKWKHSIEMSMQDFIATGQWPHILRILLPLIEELPDDIRASLMSYLIPHIHERLVSDPPEYPCAPLSNFLESVAIMCPKAFFKPIFTCAASVKELTVANQLCILYVVSRFYPGLWTYDAEMMAIVLLSDAARKNPPDSATLVRGTAPLGQTVLLLEFVEHLRRLRTAQDVPSSLSALKLVNSLEIRIGVMLEAKERTTRIPPSQRVLLAMLFREARLLTRSLKPTSWLAPVIRWVTTSYRPGLDPDFISSDEMDDESESSNTFAKLSSLYIQAKSGLAGVGKRRTIAVPSPLDRQMFSKGKEDGAQDHFADRLETLDVLSTDTVSALLELLVAVSGLLSPADYSALMPVVWTLHLDSKSMRVLAPACFLVMQAAERSPAAFSDLIVEQLNSRQPTVRRAALLRVATLAGWRFQLLSQEVILDRTYRRPFKMTRPPILFVPTDMGSSVFELEEDPNDFKDKNGRVLPAELRRRLSEVGWTEEQGESDPKTEWIRTPMSRLPTMQLDSLDEKDSAADPNDIYSMDRSPEPSPTRTSPLTPRTPRTPLHQELPSPAKDATKGRTQGVKRRTIFVGTLVTLFPRLAAMTHDSDYVVANTAKHLVLDLMRDDPALLGRAIFHLISGEGEGVADAITTTRTFLHSESVLPPGMAHHILNHLAGFLKASMRSLHPERPLENFGYAAPLIAKLMPHVSKMSMREIRRAKVDMLLVPSGSLWFTDAAPPGPMFPRRLEQNRSPFDTLPTQLVRLTMARIAQNLAFLDVLRRNPQDVKIVRKSWSTVLLPVRVDENDEENIPLTTFLPNRPDSRLVVDPSLVALSLTFARSYLLLLHQMLRSMSRHLNDREELALLLGGLNRILLAHGDDTGIVMQTMLAYLTASTRFKRLYTSRGGYTLFMPAVIKVYCEAESHPSIRSIIEFATTRFYALHKESFIFQTCDVMSGVIALPDANRALLAKNIFGLFASLRNNTSLGHPDVVALSSLTRVEEKEAIMVTIAEEVPQALLASLQRSTQDKNQVTVDVPEQYEGKPFAMDDFVRLFLTVIAHNPGILRAQQFLQFLLLVVPNLYNASASTRTVLRDGVTALGNIMIASKGPNKLTKAADSSSIQPEESSANISMQNTSKPDYMMSQSSFPSDQLSMRLDYLSLVVAFTRAGGHLSSLASQRVLEVVKIILKDSRASVPRVATFMADYVRAVLVRPNRPELKEVVTLLTAIAPIISSYSTAIDFSGVFDVVSSLASDTVYANQPAFARVVITQYCAAGLDACDASENYIFSLAIRGSLIDLLNNSMLAVGADVIGELERRPPTYDFLSGVIMPLVLRMKTSLEIASDSRWAEKWRRDVYAKAWVRLLAYVLSFIQRAETSLAVEPARAPMSVLERRKSTESRASISTLNGKPAMAFTMALQILKVIVTRAEQDIYATLPGVWPQVAAILRTALADGDASFALSYRNPSAPSSPTHSPRASAQLGVDRDENPFLSPSGFGPTRSQRRSPRVIDYMTWSLIEWLCLRRSPLTLQLRLFVQEKVAMLHQDLCSPSRGGLDGTSGSPIGSSFPSTPQRNRPVSSIFSKPRRSVAAGDPASGPSTPRTSALLASASLPTFDEFGQQLSSTPRRASAPGFPGEEFAPLPRRPGFALSLSPLTPGSNAARESGPRIVHLGPAAPPSPSGAGFEKIGRRPGSPGRRGGLGLLRSALAVARELHVEAPLLVRATYRRVRVAQAMLGYSVLLTGNGSGSSGDEDYWRGAGESVEGLVRAWSRAEALEALVQETRDLVEEWREDDGMELADESGILVDVEDSVEGHAM